MSTLYHSTIGHTHRKILPSWSNCFQLSRGNWVAVIQQGQKNLHLKPNRFSEGGGYSCILHCQLKFWLGAKGKLGLEEGNQNYYSLTINYRKRDYSLYIFSLLV